VTTSYGKNLHLSRVTNQRLAGPSGNDMEILGQNDGRAVSVFGANVGKTFGLGLGASHFAARLEECDCRCYFEPRAAKEMTQIAHEIGIRLKSILSRQPTGGALSFAAL
jgi:hypothetical protein